MAVTGTLLGSVKLFEESEKLVWYTLFLNGLIELAELGSNGRMCMCIGLASAD